MKNIVLKIILTTALFLSSWRGMAQLAPGGSPENPDPFHRGPEAPIDGALVFLFAAAIGLGLYMVARNYKKKALKS